MPSTKTMPISTRGCVFVLSGPSGAGKSTLAKELCRVDNRCRLSISATTRAPRPGESEGTSYFFLSHEAFEQKIAEGAFVEYEEYAGNYYGTPLAFLEETINAGQHVILDIEVKGAAVIARNYPSARRIFVLPTTPELLVERLVGRQTEEPAVLAKRLTVARNEILRMGEYDYLVINGTLDAALDQLRGIISAESCLIRGGECEQWLSGRDPEAVLHLPEDIA